MNYHRRSPATDGHCRELLIDTQRHQYTEARNMQTFMGERMKRFQRGAPLCGLASMIDDIEQGVRLLIRAGGSTRTALRIKSGAAVPAVMDFGNSLPVAAAARQRRAKPGANVYDDGNRLIDANLGRAAASASAGAIDAGPALRAFKLDRFGTALSGQATNASGVAI